MGPPSRPYLRPFSSCSAMPRPWSVTLTGSRSWPAMPGSYSATRNNSPSTPPTSCRCGTRPPSFWPTARSATAYRTVPASGQGPQVYLAAYDGAVGHDAVARGQGRLGVVDVAEDGSEVAEITRAGHLPGEDRVAGRSPAWTERRRRPVLAIPAS